MADATKLPTSTQMRYFDWKGDPHFTRNPAIDGSGTYTLYWSVAPLDSNDAIITGGFEVTSTAKDGENYTFWVPASAVAADGLSATGCVGGIRPNGLDYTTKDTTFAPTSTTILAGMKITCGIPAVLGELLRAAIQGVIQTGSVSINLGTGSSEDAYIYHNGNPWLKQTSAGVAQYYNGSSYVSFNDSIASSLVKVSATDTTPDYLQGKVGSSDASITISVTGSGADETLNLVTSLPARISSHAVYTPAYMTGGASAETNTALWDSVTDGSFRATIDGTAYNFDAIDLTGITSMADVASTIQTKMRTVTGTTLTVVWSTNKFVITSSNTTSSSQISVLSTSTGTVGTDISGAGAGAWMDSETGRGTATAAVLDPTQDSGKLGLLNARGSFPADLARDFVDPLGYQAKGGIMVATAANTVDELAVGSNNKVLMADSIQSTGVKWGDVLPLGNNGFGSYYHFPVPLLALSVAATSDLVYSVVDSTEPNGANVALSTLFTIKETNLTYFALESLNSFTYTGTDGTQGRYGLATNAAALQSVYNSINAFVGFGVILTDGAAGNSYDLYSVTSDGAAATTNLVGTDFGLGAANPHLLRMVYTTTSVLFYVDGVLVATHTANIPTVTKSYVYGLSTGTSASANQHGGSICAPNMTFALVDLY